MMPVSVRFSQLPSSLIVSPRLENQPFLSYVNKYEPMNSTSMVRWVQRFRYAVLMFVLFTLTVGLAPGLRCQEAEETVSTNLGLYQQLAACIADSIAAQDSGMTRSSVRVMIAPSDVRWFLQDAVDGSFRTRGWHVDLSDTAMHIAEIGILQMQVRYGEVRREGFLGERMTDRSVRMVAHTRLYSPRSGVVLSTGDVTAHHEDTVAVSLLGTIENPLIPMTKGYLPPEGFFSTWAEPLVIIGAIAVAVYLLFTVRS
jgi:hypothetical protein